jgi:hypothetical protein
VCTHSVFEESLEPHWNDKILAVYLDTWECKLFFPKRVLRVQIITGKCTYAHQQIPWRPRCWDSFRWLLNPLIVASSASTRHLAKAEFLGKHWAKAFAVDWQNGPTTRALSRPALFVLAPAVLDSDPLYDTISESKFGSENTSSYQFYPIPFSEFSESFPRVFREFPEICRDVWSSEVWSSHALRGPRLQQQRPGNGAGSRMEWLVSSVIKWLDHVRIC